MVSFLSEPMPVATERAWVEQYCWLLTRTNGRRRLWGQHAGLCRGADKRRRERSVNSGYPWVSFS